MIFANLAKANKSVGVDTSFGKGGCKMVGLLSMYLIHKDNVTETDTICIAISTQIINKIAIIIIK